MSTEFPARSLSPQESRVVLTLTEHGRREVSREDIIQLLAASPESADYVIRSLRRKGWLQQASWGKYLLIPPDQGPEALGEGNLLALASRIAEPHPYYLGYGTAAAHYGLTTQHRSTIWIVTPARLRDRHLNDSKVRIVNPVPRKFFGFSPVDVLGYAVQMSDIEKTAIDCIDRPDLCGGIGEAATILAAASRRCDWSKVASYLQQIASKPLTQRCGWLADHVGAEIPTDARAQIRQLASKGRKTFLGPKKAPPGAIGYDETWHLVVNVTPAELHGSAGLGRKQSIRKDT
jgi:predicted transcriptional regulator of viral defense system